MDRNELKRRTTRFAHNCLKITPLLQKSLLGRHIAGQLTRASTSVPANYRAACLAHSRAGFISKISIVIEEADESAFWLEFAVDEKLLMREDCGVQLKEAFELTSIFMATRKTAGANEIKS